MPKPLKIATTWRFQASAPPREVFATAEQLLGVPPYRFQQLDETTAEVVEVSRLGLAGNWTSRVRNPAWVRIEARQAEHGTAVQVSASRRPFALSRGARISGAGERALQLVRLLSTGTHDYRTIYRDRHIPAGPISLVASWAGTPYPLFVEPRFDSPRGTAILTASRIVSTGEGSGPFIKVVLPDGTGGWVERDQCVPGSRDLDSGGAAGHCGPRPDLLRVRVRARHSGPDTDGAPSPDRESAPPSTGVRPDAWDGCASYGVIPRVRRSLLRWSGRRWFSNNRASAGPSFSGSTGPP